MEVHSVCIHICIFIIYYIYKRTIFKFILRNVFVGKISGVMTLRKSVTFML